MAITSLGIGSGIDINGLVGQLVQAEKEAPEKRLALREASLQAQLTSVGTLKGALSSFQTKVGRLKTASGASGLQATVSDRSVLTTNVSFTAEEGSHNIEVKNLAQAQTLVTKAFSKATTEVGSGTLSFTFGAFSKDEEGNLSEFTANAEKTVKTVEIADGSLEGIRDAVNAANIGVKASIVNVGPEGYKLLFNGEEVGDNNNLQIKAVDADGNHTDDVGLSQLTYDVGSEKMEETAAAKHAEILYNGLSIKRSSNTVDDLIKGVTLNLASVSDEGKSVTVNVSKNVGAIKTRMQDFITGYNEVVSTISGLTAFDPKSGRGGVFLGDAVTRNISGQLRKIISEPVRIGDGSVVSLASVGVTTQKDGSLVLNEEIFNAEAEKNPDIVANLLSLTGNAQGSDLKYIGVSASTQEGTYRVNVSQPATQGKFSAAASLAGNYVVNDSNNTMQFEVNGVQSGSITIASADYGNAEALAAKIQASINDDSALREAGVSVEVSVENDKLVVSSSEFGSESTVKLLSASGLGLTGGASVDGLDIEGNFGRGAATGKGQFLLGSSGPAEGLQIEYSGSASGIVGGVTASRGYADQLFNAIESFLADDGGIEGKTKNLQDGIVDIEKDRIDLAGRLLVLEKRWRSQFGAMDALVAQLQSTGNFLTQQLESLPKIEVR